MLSFTLTVCPVMAEETREAASATEQTDAGENLMSGAQALLDEEKYEEAIPLLQKAADMGDEEAQAELGGCYDKGNGVEQDDEKALKYFRLAAEQGNPKGLYGLGLLYDTTAEALIRTTEWPGSITSLRRIREMK